ncbi:hypothetical protein EsH8_I_001613 [Colletotrichum jinshuiense]
MASKNGNSHTSGALPTAAEPIAIVSVACRLPGHATSPQKLWEFLQAGGIAVSDTVPGSRYNSAGHFDGSGKPGTMKALSGMYIEDIDPAEFDAPFFNINRADAVAMDPQQRQLLEVVYECLENGGITLEKISGEDIGCYVGSYSADYHDIQNRSPEQRVPGMTVGIGRAILSNRISHFLNIKGASWTIDSACSGGLVGVDVACQYLRAGKLSAAIVAGVNLWMSPEHLEELGTLRAAYSASGRCHTFDAKADGYCRAEAVNAVFLKRLSDAIKDGDPIRAVIRGTANNSDGRTPGINSPSSEAQAAVTRAAYADAGLDSSHYAETGYLECHGTGTPAGDPLEVKGAASVLAHMRPSSEPLIIGSLKSNIGHSEPGAGISGLIKATMAVESGTIPGNPTFITPNPNIDFEGLRVRPTRWNIPWPKTSSNYRRASVNSFGYGGSNAHAVLENTEQFIQHHNTWIRKKPSPYVSSYIKTTDLLSLIEGNGVNERASTGNPQVLVFSANDQDTLKRQIEAISSHLLDPRVSINLSDLSYTLSERRSRHFFRAFMLSRPARKGKAGSIAMNLVKYARRPQTATRIGFVFTGQGAQWSQMGAELIRMFPKTARAMVEKLDAVLQGLPAEIRPEWSLLEELTVHRAAEHLRKPEFSQPLVTALQLALLAVLASWGVRADVVVGHSSGEIAAAYSAGLITSAQAILAAYFRGLAAKEESRSMGMMAVGLGAESVMAYLDSDTNLSNDVAIACYNSPSSITLSGPAALLAKLAETIKADGHFARLLHVDLAYHSRHMSEIAQRYENLLLNHGRFSDDEGNRIKAGAAVSKPFMVSSVTEEPLAGPEACGTAYWKSNMVSPVRFAGACKKALTDSENFGATCLIEIGPSNTLSGPVGQIIKESGVQNANYISAAKRGEESILALFDVAGQLFLDDATLSLRNVNSDETAADDFEPAVIVDLPNYKWNHSTKYWHESLASKDWRLRKFPEHDLLGSKVLGTLWQSPSWRKTLRLADSPWLRDHMIGTEILFPAAGYIAMAIEAVRQTVLSTMSGGDTAFLTSKDHYYSLRDVRFTRGLVLQNDVDTTVMLSLAPVPKLGAAWWEYKVLSLADPDASSTLSSSDTWNENSKGLIRVEIGTAAQDALPRAPLDLCDLPLRDPSPGSLWYKAMTDAGYGYGPDFQKQLYVESRQGKPSSRSLVSLEPPKSKWNPQSQYYPMHPAPLDGCLQSVFTSLHRGNRSSFDEVLLPAGIDSIIASGGTYSSGNAVASTTSRFMLVGNPEESRKTLSDASVYDPDTRNLILELRGVSFSTMDVRDSVYLSHNYARIAWKPDFAHLDTDQKLQQAISRIANDSADAEIQELLDLAAHKTPNLSVLEFNLAPDVVKSLWLDGAGSQKAAPRAAIREFHYASDSADVILASRDMYSQSAVAQNARFTLLDPFSRAFSPPTELPQFHLMVVRMPYLISAKKLDILARNIHRLLANTGSVIFQLPSDGGKPANGTMTNGDAAKETDLNITEDRIMEALVHKKFTKIRRTRARIMVADAAPGLDAEHQNDDRDVILVGLCSENIDIVAAAAAKLKEKGWNISEAHLKSGLELEQLPPKSTVLVLDEVSQPVMATATEGQWKAIKTVIQRECNLLWVTQGSQMEVTAPLKSVCHGVFRTVRAEEPLSCLNTLDVESATMENLDTMVSTIETSLNELKSRRSSTTPPAEYEYAERGGILHISRVWLDDGLNQVKLEDSPGGLSPVMVDLHASKSTIRMAAERLGSLDALQFYEVDGSESEELGPDEIEIELFASSCNYKEVAVAMGIVPEDEKRLGWDGAGVVVRVGSSITNRHVGQRVAVQRSGCFGNRVTASHKVTFPIPHTMSFEEAATLPIIFGTAIYGLYHLANLQRGQRVLIHSAAGGVGIACIQLCQRLDCEVFATVGNSEKRKFLTTEFGIPDDHIFSSRSAAFARGIREVTQGYGVDVVVNSLIGNLLDESWRLLAAQGTLVHIAKRDSFDRNWLFMEPFAQNCSIRSLDIIGGLKGVCGSLAIHLARQGAKYLSIMSRSGYEDHMSQSVVRDLKGLGCSIDLLQGDVSLIDDVKRCFEKVSAPVGGIIQGAAVFRDRTFESMTHEDYQAALSCKVQGTWNLHCVSMATQQPIGLFTMLSSTSGLVGQKGQSNYAGGNVFMDALAAHRRTLGLPATSINLGPIEDIGVIQGNENLEGRFDRNTWFGINEGLLRRIVDYSFLQQHPDPKRRPNIASQAQMITGIVLPQPQDSELVLRDVRFAGLVAGGDGHTSSATSGASSGDKDLEAFFLLARSSNPDRSAVVSAAVAAVGAQFVRQLRLSESMDPARPLSVYGMDSLAAVEFRNWVRLTFGAELTTLDVMNAVSLVALCDKVVLKMGITRGD